MSICKRDEGVCVCLGCASPALAAITRRQDAPAASLTPTEAARYEIGRIARGEAPQLERVDATASKQAAAAGDLVGTTFSHHGFLVRVAAVRVHAPRGAQTHSTGSSGAGAGRGIIGGYRPS